MYPDMMYPDMMNAVSEGVGVLVGFLVVFSIVYLLSIGLGIASYILHALGLYTIAQRRGIKHPWMAWVPVLNLWTLGSISDQYQYVTQGLIRNRRKLLIGLQIGVVVLWIISFCLYIGMFVNIIAQIPAMEHMDESQMVKLFSPAIGMMVVSFAMSAVGIVTTVFTYICAYNLFASCQPKNKTLFLVLSIIFPVVYAFFVFACRNKDLGMPPRKDAAPQQPVYTQPAYQQPVYQQVQPQALPAQPRPEPWENAE